MCICEICTCGMHFCPVHMHSRKKTYESVKFDADSSYHREFSRKKIDENFTSGLERKQTSNFKSVPFTHDSTYHREFAKKQCAVVPLMNESSVKNLPPSGRGHIYWDECDRKWF